MSLDLMGLYTQLTDAINDIDEKLDSLDDSGAVTSRRIINELVSSNEETWKSVANSLVSQLETVPVEVQVGVFYGLVRQLNEGLGKQAKEYVATLAATAPKAEPLITPDEVGPLSETRKGLYAKAKALIEMATTFGDEDAEKMEMPKRRMGATGPRGKRALSLFAWNIEGVDFDKLKDVIENYPQYEAVKDLTAAMREAGIDTKSPGNDISFTLPDGKILVGVNTEPVTPEDDTDEDDDDTATDSDDGTEEGE